MSVWRGRTVLVTGYAGFLGGALARALIGQQARVLGLVNPARLDPKGDPNPGETRNPADAQVEIVPADIRDIAAVREIFHRHKIDTVFHLAAQTRPTLARVDPCLSFEVNTRGTWNLFEAARLAPVVPAILLSSTDSVYGENNGDPFAEHVQLASVFPYEASKSCMEMVARCYHGTYNIPVGAARFCNLYGPGDMAEDRLVVGTIQAAFAGRRQTLRGDGRAVRNYLYVDDAIHALLTLAEALHRPGIAGEAFNFCDETPYSVLDIVGRVLALTGRPDLSPGLGAGTPGELSIKRASAAKAARMLDWHATTGLDEGLRRTIEWHRARQPGHQASASAERLGELQPAAQRPRGGDGMGVKVARPKVSVVIPTYMMAEYLPISIDSVLRQTMTDFELIVLDNASPDDTPAVMARYNDPRITYVRNKANLGLAGNVHRGFELASGEYLTFLGTDDRWLPEFLQQATAFLDDEPGVTLVHGPAAWIDLEGRRFGGSEQRWDRITAGPDAMLGAFSSGFCFATMVMRRAALAATGPFDEKWLEVIDLWMLLRMCLAGHIGYLDQVLCEYRVHEAAMSMPMYRDNVMFRRQLTAVREAFAWPEAVAIGADRHREAARRAIARTAVDVLHMSHSAGRAQLVRNLTEIVSVYPSVVTWPRTWARAGFGLLPSGAIRNLQRQKRRLSLTREAGETAATMQ